MTKFNEEINKKTKNVLNSRNFNSAIDDTVDYITEELLTCASKGQVERSFYIDELVQTLLDSNCYLPLDDDTANELYYSDLIADAIKNRLQQDDDFIDESLYMRYRYVEHQTDKTNRKIEYHIVYDGARDPFIHPSYIMFNWARHLLPNMPYDKMMRTIDNGGKPYNDRLIDTTHDVLVEQGFYKTCQKIVDDAKHEMLKMAGEGKCSYRITWNAEANYYLKLTPREAVYLPPKYQGYQSFLTFAVKSYFDSDDSFISARDFARCMHKDKDFAKKNDKILYRLVTKKPDVKTEPPKVLGLTFNWSLNVIE